MVDKKVSFSMNVLLTILVLCVVILSTATIIKKPVVNIYSTVSDNNDVREANTLLVKGVYNQEVDPDLVKISLSIVTEAKDAKSVSSENEEISSNVINALKRVGLEDDEISSKGLWLHKKQEWNPVLKKYEDKGYTATHTLEIKTKKINKLSLFLNTAVDNGVNSISSLEFSLSNEKKRVLEKELLREAALDAREKAEALASTLGKKVVDVVRIDEESRSFVPYKRYLDYDYATAASPAPLSENNIMPEKINTGTSVSVIFKIE